MKRNDLIALLQALPESADIQLVDAEYGGGQDIAAVIPAGSSYGFMFGHRFHPAPADVYVLEEAQ